ncbi:MAG: hypothetical protein ACI398_04510 [Clostridium sp.]
MKFNINEIITIVMEEVRILENEKIYGIQEEAEYPLNTYNKIESLNDDEFSDFMEKINRMAEEILEIKSGELNELNKCHEEIMYLSEEYLSDYLEK